MKIFKYIIVILFITNNSFSKELYYSDEYVIQFKSDNIQNKKEESINSIKYISFKTLVNSILTIEEYEKLNRILTINLINKFLFSININEEKINNKNYFSKVQIIYDNSKVIDYLISNNINFVPYEPEKFLLIVFDQKLFSENILSKENRFYEYLSSNKNKYKYFIIPKLDINDRYIIKKDDFYSKKIKNIEQLNNKYSNKYILLVHSISDLNDIKINSYVYRNDNFQMIDTISFSEIKYESFFKNLHNKALNYWKNDNIVLTSKITNINCRIKTLNLIELKKIKEIIEKNNIIRKINPRVISYNNSTYDLFYYGKLDILIKSLKIDQLELNSFENKCNIKIL